jgi:glycosyltransferase involved in cell wall biosynthesis
MTAKGEVASKSLFCHDVSISNPKIKILHLIKSLGRGGAEMLLPESLKLHDHTRFEFHYIYFLPWKSQMVEAIQKSDGNVICFKASNNIQIMFKIWRIARYIKENNIDLVHAHLPWAGFAGRLVHRLTSVPLIYTEHNKQERYHFLTRWVNRYTFNWQTCAVAVSQDVADSIRININPSIPVLVVLNGVNTDFFQRSVSESKIMRQKLNIQEETVVVGTVAVFRFQKRLKEWLEVFKKASERNPELLGIIVGDGPLRNEIENQIKLLNLEGRVIMPGLQTEVRPWYSIIDIFLMTSEFEGLPVALLEAMSMECAVVTTDAGGIKEVVVKGENGWMEPVENWPVLAGHIHKLANDKEKRKALAVAGRKTVVDAFSMGRMVKALEGLYAAHISKRP